MHFDFPEEIISIKEVAKKFAEKRLAPITEKDYEDGITRKEILEEMGRLGFFGCLIPEKYGGTDTGYLVGVIITETLATINASYAGCSMAQLAGPPLTLLKFGTDEQKEKYIPGIISGKLVALFGATEPDAGSDISAMRTNAIDKGDYYLINGSKSWITNATNSDIGLIWVCTDKNNKRRGISCFIIDMKNANGIKTKKTEKLGLKCSQVGEIFFEDVKIPKKNLVGEAGKGIEVLMFTLSNTRLFAAARALGVGQICLEESLKYAKERMQFGKPIGEFQLIQNQLVEMYTEHEAAKNLVYQVAINKDRGIHDITELATAKLFACEAGTKAALTAMRIFSSYGYALEYPIHRYVRDALAFPITEGTSNIQKVIIAKNILKKS